MYRIQKRMQKGYNLAELLISMLIGTILAGGATTAYVNTIKNSADNIANVRLEQDMQAITQLISAEMRRAGFDGDANLGADTDFNISTSSACILYSYDSGGNDVGGTYIATATPDGTLDDEEKFGFRISSQAIQYGIGVTSCSATSTGWVNINDTNTTLMTTFTVSLTELCINLKDNSNCSSDDAATSSNAYVAPVSGDKMIKKYQLTFSIIGRSTDDATKIKSVTTSIRLLNDFKKTKS